PELFTADSAEQIAKIIIFPRAKLDRMYVETCYLHWKYGL
ncbi:hypothetical protein L915_13636, partial [Phytophthora nicotianae]